VATAILRLLAEKPFAALIKASTSTASSGVRQSLSDRRRSFRFRTTPSADSAGFREISNAAGFHRNRTPSWPVTPLIG
jgi:hypothetical protein